MENLCIAVAVHSYGNVPPEVYSNHVGVFARWAKQFNLKFMHIDGLKVAEARNKLVGKAKEEGCTHIFFLDADHIVEDSLLPVLVGNMEECTMVSGLVIKRVDDEEAQVAFVKDPNSDYFVNLLLPIDGLSYDVDACAFGCTLIDLKAFDNIEEPYFKDVMYRDPEGKLRQRRSDMEFCREVRAHGGKIRIDTRAIIGHLGYPKVYYPKDRQFQLHTYRKAAEICEGLDAPTVIDFGCGHGRKLVELIEPHSQNVFGVDLPDCIRVCKERYSGSRVKWQSADLNDCFNASEKADVVICADVLEHLERPCILINSIVDAMKGDGVAVISTPDVSTIGENVKVNPEHRHFWSEVEFASLLNSDKLRIIKIEREREVTDYFSMIATCRKKVAS